MHANWGIFITRNIRWHRRFYQQSLEFLRWYPGQPDSTLQRALHPNFSTPASDCSLQKWLYLDSTCKWILFYSPPIVATKITCLRLSMNRYGKKSQAEKKVQLWSINTALHFLVSIICCTIWIHNEWKTRDIRLRRTKKRSYMLGRGAINSWKQHSCFIIRISAWKKAIWDVQNA